MLSLASQIQIVLELMQWESTGPRTTLVQSLIQHSKCNDKEKIKYQYIIQASGFFHGHLISWSARGNIDVSNWEQIIEAVREIQVE